MTPAELAPAWRQRAAELDRFAPPAAEAFRAAAEELDAALREAADEPLTLAEAAEESGYSERRLRELVAAGEIPQAGRKHAPRIRRGDLPRRPGAGKDAGSYDPISDAASLMGKL